MENKIKEIEEKFNESMVNWKKDFDNLHERKNAYIRMFNGDARKVLKNIGIISDKTIVCVNDGKNEHEGIYHTVKVNRFGEKLVVIYKESRQTAMFDIKETEKVVIKVGSFNDIKVK